uniref:Uncharacterized protein n=1 Tax=Chaetoceros debilis TaxID=122233 RepID=A0A7S3QDQ0_9STRA
MSPYHRLWLKPIQILLHTLKSKGWQDTLQALLCQCSIVIATIKKLLILPLLQSWEHTAIGDDQSTIQKVFYHLPILGKSRQEAFHNNPLLVEKGDSRRINMCPLATAPHI